MDPGTTVTAPLPEGAEAWSLLGEALHPPALSPEVREEREAQLARALEDLEADPASVDALIWVGRRHAYLGAYRTAVEIFTRGIQANPEDPRLYRHRGHRYITLRELDRAIADFRQGAALIQGTEDQVEPDGQPNAAGIPTSTLHFNIWYHYGLAHYLKGEFDRAAEIYERCMEASVHPDSRVATAHWWYMALRRAGRDAEARRLVEGMDLEALAGEVIESGSYLELLRLYARGGEAGEAPDPLTLEGATRGYGIGNWRYYNGDREGALAVFRGVVDARDQWAAFGYIAAEAELAREMLR
jgi:tetratricopeptide (TPR) repeat protein